MKKELGSGTTFLSLWVRASTSAGRFRRSTARTWIVSQGKVLCGAVASGQADWLAWYGMDFGVVGLRKRVGLGKHGELVVLIVRVLA